MNIIRKAKISVDKRSVDVYGRSVELAIATHLLDTGTFPTSIEQLTIEYSGDRVECSTAQLKSDSSIYLAGCTVGGRSVEGYTYGKEEVITYNTYEIGDEVTYNNVDYRVIKDSSASEETVTLLKAEPLSYSDVQTYSQGTGTQTQDVDGYGGMQYHSSSIAYEGSYIKTTVDAWKTAQAPAAIDARLITYQELEDNLGYDHGTPEASWINVNPEYTPSWVYNSNYWYWTMTTNTDKTADVWYVDIRSHASVDSSSVQSYYRAVRPVITLSKTNISS